MNPVSQETHETSYHLEGVAFGLADGLIMSLGLIIGVAEVTTDPGFVILAGIVGGFANAFGNSIGFFMSQSAERGLQIQDSEERNAQTKIHSKKEIYMNSFLAFACSIGIALLLLFPFLLVTLSVAVILAFVIGILVAFTLGSYIGKMCREHRLISGFKYAAVAVTGAVVSHLVADLLSILL
jgi:predicted membrane protein (TIGR00267 family)